MTFLNLVVVQCQLWLIDSFHEEKIAILVVGNHSWYLDNRNLAWDTVYANEICEGVPDHLCQRFVLGGQGEMCVTPGLILLGRQPSHLIPMLLFSRDRNIYPGGENMWTLRTWNKLFGRA